MNEKKAREGLELLKSNGAFAAMNQDAIDLIEEALQPEVRFYKGQPVLVMDGGDQWHKDRLIGLLNDRVNMYDCDDGLWVECKPDPEAVSLPNWTEIDGTAEVAEIPKNTLLVVDHENELPEIYTHQDSVMFGKKAKRYAIIPLPEFL